MRTFRKGNSHYLLKDPPIIFLPDNEFNLFLKENPELAQDAEKYSWNIGLRYQEAQPKTKEEFEKLFAQSVEYVQRSASPRAWKVGLHRELLWNYLLPNDAGQVLDFGCGAGNDGLFYASLGLKVTFTDVDGVNLDFVRWRLARRGINFCSVMSSDHPLQPKTFDLALVIDVLEHIVDAHNYFVRIEEAIKPGGFLYLSFNSSNDELDCYSFKQFYENIQPGLNTQFEQVDDCLYQKKGAS